MNSLVKSDDISAYELFPKQVWLALIDKIGITCEADRQAREAFEVLFLEGQWDEFADFFRNIYDKCNPVLVDTMYRAANW